MFYCLIFPELNHDNSTVGLILTLPLTLVLLLLWLTGFSPFTILGREERLILVLVLTLVTGSVFFSPPTFVDGEEFSFSFSTALNIFFSAIFFLSRNRQCFLFTSR